MDSVCRKQATWNGRQWVKGGMPVFDACAQVQALLEEWVEDQVTRIEDNKCAAPLFLTRFFSLCTLT
jgi:hypothetical protein